MLYLFHRVAPIFRRIVVVPGHLHDLSHRRPIRAEFPREISNERVPSLRDTRSLWKRIPRLDVID